MKTIISDPCDEVEHIYHKSKSLNTDFKCDKCLKDLQIDEIGYMGDPNGGSDCSIYTTILTLCKRCVNVINKI